MGYFDIIDEINRLRIGLLRDKGLEASIVIITERQYMTLINDCYIVSPVERCKDTIKVFSIPVAVAKRWDKGLKLPAVH